MTEVYLVAGSVSDATCYHRIDGDGLPSCGRDGDNWSETTQDELNRYGLHRCQHCYTSVYEKLVASHAESQ